jgi:hypothetical protein
MTRITKLKMTCSACPSQWEGMTEDGRHVYVRYRWGHLSACVGPTIDAAIWPTEDNGGEILLDKSIGDDLDGVMTGTELRGHLLEVNVVVDPTIPDTDPWADFE